MKVLSGWKEIASYLQSSVRTVQRWERTEGLPVQRHRHSQRATVYALPSQVDEWLRQRNLPTTDRIQGEMAQQLVELRAPTKRQRSAHKGNSRSIRQ